MGSAPILQLARTSDMIYNRGQGLDPDMKKEEDYRIALQGTKERSH